MGHPVETLHPAYAEHQRLCERVDDACAGEHMVKKKTTKYLPMPTMFKAGVDLNEAKGRYKEYLERAVFVGVSGETLNKLVGLPFQRVPELRLPEELENLEKNADGAGRSIYQLSQRAIKNILKHYRVGLYVDFPNGVTANARTVAEQKKLKVAPKIHCVDSKNIVHWDSTVINNERKLWLVVIREAVSSIGANGFEMVVKNQYRVLRLVEGVYTVQVFSKNSEGEYVGSTPVIPKDYQGQPWTEIPFTFCNATDLSDEIDTPPMMEIVNLNFAHYRNSADEEESSFLLGQPFLCFTDMDARKYKELEKMGGLSVGSRNAVAAKIEVVQVSENTLVGKVAKDKIELMEKMGASMTQAGSANKTATQSNNESAIQHSVLSLVVSNVSEALQICLGWCARFAISEKKEVDKDELFFAISQEFSKVGFENEKAKRLWDACVMGVVPFKIWFEYEQTGKFTEMSWDEVEGLIEEQAAKMPANNGYVPKDEGLDDE